MDNEQWMTIKETADFLKCSESTVRRRIAAGELKVMKSGRLVRIDKAALLAMMNQEPPKENEQQ